METKKSMTTRSRLKKLYQLNDKIRYEMLGESDTEYKEELERLQEKVLEEIQICKDKIENNQA